jgi:hypothetical protein
MICSPYHGHHKTRSMVGFVLIAIIAITIAIAKAFLA